MRRVAVVALAALALAGCASTELPVDDGLGVPLPMPVEEGIGGEIPPTLLVAPETSAGYDALVSGELALNVFNCVTIDGQLLVAPAGSMIEGTTVSLAGYGSFELGDPVSQLAGGEETIAVADATPEQIACIPGDDTEVTYTVVSPVAR